jgi:hybrid cluster-associated redox disulfide protein
VDPSPLLADGDLDLTITEYLARRPEAVDVFIALRLGCLGCDFSSFDTLRQALVVHGVTLQDYRSQFEGLRPPGGRPIPSEGDAR